MVIGDFNELTGLSEKGGAMRPAHQMKKFVDTLNWCGLKDMGFAGSKFTWLYRKSDGTQIRCED